MENTEIVDAIVERLSEVEEDIYDLDITIYDRIDRLASVLHGEVDLARRLVENYSESVVAFVIAHEYAHEFCNDSKADAERRGDIIESIEKTWSNKQNGLAWKVGATLFKGFFSGVLYFGESRAKEMRADFIAAAIIKDAGYLIDDAVEFLRRSGGSDGLFSSHPDGHDRANALKAFIKEHLE